jgi:prolyl oligopeptidase
VDEYRWLEDGKDPAVRAWSEAQLKVTRGVLDGPVALGAAGALQGPDGNGAVSLLRIPGHKGGLFALKSQPPKNQPSLVLLKSACRQ